MESGKRDLIKANMITTLNAEGSPGQLSTRKL